MINSEGETVELLPRVVEPVVVTRVPAVFVFLVVGGVDNSGGLVAVVEMIMSTI